MLRADRRVVVSHVGSLVRPPAMIPYLEKIRDNEPYDEAAFEKCLTDSVGEAVRLQAEAGIDVVSDGEYGKSVNWAFYFHRRLSTDGQSVAAQVADLRKHGAGKVFREVASGIKTERTQLRRILDQLDPGDVLMVTRLDRLARSTRDLLNTLAAIADRKAGFRSLGDTWADTTTAHGRMMLTFLGGLAEFERDLIRAGTSEGRERAKARGVKLGRKPKLTEHQKREAIRRRDVDGETVPEIARSYNVSHSTISRLTAS